MKNPDEWVARGEERLQVLRLTYHAVEFGGLVSLWSAVGTLVFSRAKLSKVLGGFGDRVGEEVHLDSA